MEAQPVRDSRSVASEWVRWRRREQWFDGLPDGILDIAFESAHDVW